MEFYMPTRVYHEKDAVLNHASEIAAIGKKALIVTGKSSSKKNGSLADVKKAREEHGPEYIVFNEIEENPSIATVMKAAEIGRNQGTDFVIGVGGGSPMDASKAIALMIHNRDTSEEVLYQKIDLKALPVVEVPTTCGTGSEVTPYAILTRDDKKTKQSISHKIYPVIACVDAKYLMNAPKSVIVNTAIDALGHFIESYFNKRATDYSCMLCQYGMSVWAENLDVLLGEDVTEERCNSLLLASTLAGMAITHTGTSIPHGMSYYLTYNMDVPHGKAVGMFLPGYLKLMSKQFEDEVAMILAGLGFASIEQFAFFIKQCMEVCELSKTDKQNILNEIMENPGKMASIPFEVSESDVREVVEFMGK